MLYNLIFPYVNKFHIANLFHYITFRAISAVLLSFLICFFSIPKLIKYLHIRQKHGQPIRDDIPSGHKAKVGTPTMGGIAIIISSVITSVLFIDLHNKYIWSVLLIFLGFGFIGFIDDYAKIVKNNHYGLSGKKKLILQFLITVIACLYLNSIDKNFCYLSIPFFKNLFLDIGLFYIPFAIFVIVGSSNAVNLTDGLDGLATIPISVVAGCFAIICYLIGSSIYSEYLQIIYIPEVGELSIFCASIIGSALGFLWYNAQPAEIFMGDVGSLSLGGALGVLSVITKHEFVLSILGGVFVMEALSVIIQVYYFKLSGGKRVFKMAPLHHHFEKHGWSESKVVIRFWIISIIFAIIGLSSLKLR